MRTMHPALALAILLALGPLACERAEDEADETAADTTVEETAPEITPQADVASYQLIVTNPMPHAMNVSATMQDGSQVQLGTVPASGEGTFIVSGSAGESIDLVAVDEANTHSPSGTVTLSAGDTTVRWTIQ